MRHFEDTSASLADKRIFRKVYLMKAFRQIPIAEDGLPKTAVITPFALYEFTVMTFDHRNAAQSFQHFMDETVGGLDFCISYVDDIIMVASRNPDQREKHLRALFE